MCRRLPSRLLTLALVGFLAGVPFIGEAGAAENRVLRVACASDMRFAFEELMLGFRQKHKDVEVRASYGSSGNFYAQLSNRAPFDLYLSADVDYPRKLIKDGLARPETEFLYGVGRIVVWVPKDSPIDLEKSGIEALLDPGVRKVAIANPRYAPYGRAAEAAMKKLGVYEKVQDRLVQGDSILQAAQFIESGAADIGIISHSLTLRPPLQGKGRTWEVPVDAYPRLEQGGVILKWAEDLPAAEAMRAFVMGSEGKAILHKFGFETP